MLVATVIGNRPQFIKAAAVAKHLRELGSELLIHSGQHYDPQLSEIFFNELDLPQPDLYLDCGGGSNSTQTARIISTLEPVLTEQKPDLVLVYGDTNTTLAAGLTARQLSIPVAHVEAGMRSFDATMPEELNRVLVDHLSDLLFCSSAAGAEQLRSEAINKRIEVVGDVMVDVALDFQARVRGSADLLDELKVTAGNYYLATVHRAGNVDSLEQLRQVVNLLATLPIQVVLPLHPRTEARLREFGLLEELKRSDNVTLTEPLGYLDFTTLLCSAKAVLTDSGGVQKEAYLAEVPCITLRENTEWTETVTAGWNTLVGLDSERLKAALTKAAPAEHPTLYGDGKAGRRVAETIESYLKS